MNKAVNITVLLPVKSQPRYHKRIRGLKTAGAIVSGFYFERSYFEGAQPPCEVKSLGRIEHGAYTLRLLQLFRSARKIRPHIHKDSVLYAFGLDMAILVLLAGFGRSYHLIYEVGDLRPIQFATGVKANIVRGMERLVLRNIRKLVVTASGFMTGYYSKRHKTENLDVQIIENKLDIPCRDRLRPEIHKNKKPIIIGYFGLLRCVRSWQTLKAIARQGAGSIHVVVRGFSLGIDIQSEADKELYVTYGGDFIAPDDLSSMYAEVDLVWGCYPVPETFSEGNWKWARTNRFYESCFFRRPMVALAGTDEANEVVTRNIGIALDLTDPEEAARQLLAELPEQLSRWQRATLELPDSLCCYQHEHEMLIKDIESDFAE